jgi:hypothetical protein
MSGSPVARLVRGWVDLYTRGLPADARTARRDEIDDDLWCEHAEAAAAGRSARALDADRFLRLLFGIPSDITWRLTHRRAPTPPSVDRSSSMKTRTLGILAIYAGSSPALLGILHFAMGDAMWALGVPVVFAFGTLFAFPAAALGIAWRFQDRLGLSGAIGAILMTLGSVLIILAPTASLPPLAVGSAMLMWNLARTGVARPAAIAQLTALSLVVGLALLNAAHTSTPPIASGVALYGYLLSWVAIGVSLFRGVPQVEATSA